MNATAPQDMAEPAPPTRGQWQTPGLAELSADATAEGHGQHSDAGYSTAAPLAS